MGKEKGSRVFFEVYRKQMKEEPLPEQKPNPATGGAFEDVGKVGVSTDAGDAELREQESVIGCPSPMGAQEATPLLSPTSQVGDRGGVGLKTRHEARSQGLGLKRDEVYVRQDTLIYAALGAVFLSIGCFFIGHKLGYDKGRKVEPMPSVVASGEAPKQSQEGFFANAQNDTQLQESVPNTAPKTPQTIQSQPSVSDVPKEEKWTLRIVSYKIGDQNTKKASELARTIQKEIGHDSFIAKTSKELVVCVGKFDNKDSSELRTLQKELRDFTYENRKQFKGCYPVRIK